MPKYEFAIAVKDEVDYAPGKVRKKEGDIINLKPYPRNCGRKVIDEYLIVIVECSQTNHKALKQKLTLPLFEDGLTEDVDFREICPEDDLDPLAYPPPDYVWDLQARMVIKRPKMLAKRRYKIPLSLLGNIDLAKVRDKTCIYQPFKKATQLVSKFDGENGNHFLEEKDVDCSAPGISSGQEIVFQWSAVENLVVDKYTNFYEAPQWQHVG